MNYLLNFFGSTRKVCNVTLSLGEKYYLLDEIKEYFEKDNCNAFDDSIIDMISSVTTQYEPYKEKLRSSELGKTQRWYLSRVKNAALRERSFCSRSRLLSLENFGLPMKRANHQ